MTTKTDTANQILDQLYIEIEELLTKSEKGWQEDIDSALNLAVDALGMIIPEEEKFVPLHAGILKRLGFLYGVKGEYGIAFDQLLKSLALYEQLDDLENQVEVLRSIGGRFIDIGDFENALLYTRRSAALAEDIDFIEGVVKSWNNLAIIYERTGNFEKAKEIHLAALEQHRTIGNAASECKTLNNLADICMRLEDLTAAEKFCKEGLKLTEAAGEENHKILALCTFGEIQEAQGKLTEAEHSYKKSLEEAQEVEYTFMEAYLNLCMGKLYARRQKNNEAITAALQSGSLAELVNSKWIHAQSHKLLIKIFKNLNNYREALEHTEKYHEIKDEMQSEKLQKELLRLKLNIGADPK